MKSILKTALAAVTAIGVTFGMSGSASAETEMDEILQRGELRVGVQTQGAPVSFINKDGERTGLAIEIVKMMADDLGVKLVLQDYDWKGLIPALLASKFDFIAADMTPTPQRTAQLLFSRPFFYQDTVAMTAKDSGRTTWEDLNKEGLNVGGVQGGTYVTAIKEFLPNATVKEFASGPAAAQALAAGRVDGALTDLGNAQTYVGGYDNLMILDGIITREPLAFATRAENSHLKFWMDNYFELVSANGKLDRLVEYWWNSRDWEADHK
ncbi:extracellular solute-binding protein, family 3 family protein 7 [Nitratireductor aquibiodomus RA22]|uniref:Extracellular solute-binding protein, family 3 family protein 7 n=2 Tax=Nitratireductor aquibiodomus TaxID=204799 RepID=I5C3W4_9HYPH|nr:ABC transporter substrate-binding protein [Nitratireductor aquibiodomus]EIM76516.1 extracellular solute-binding protein, family 3 family protein 7 [Nitratireductor aquibiodomus RA22]